tara:strand:+ start:395 stop:541 length:147 start_codon:yes stop_codon:yes gene_type:complete
MTIYLKNLKVAKKDHPIYVGKIQTYPIQLSKKKTDDLRKKDKKKIKTT